MSKSQNPPSPRGPEKPSVSLADSYKALLNEHAVLQRSHQEFLEKYGNLQDEAIALYKELMGKDQEQREMMNMEVSHVLQ